MSSVIQQIYDKRKVNDLEREYRDSIKAEETRL